LEAPLCHEHFVERLTAAAHFFVARACPRFPQYLIDLGRPSDFQRCGPPREAKATEQTNFRQNSPPEFYR
jgi:hypothetical protein